MRAKTSPTSTPRPARRRHVKFVALTPLLVLLGARDGCGVTTHEVDVKQPFAFNHQAHVGYFNGGGHRKEYIKAHVQALELDDEDAATLQLTRCTMCHQQGQKARCDACHIPLLQDQALLDRKDIRACVACHRGAWSGNLATIPTAALCRNCHGQAQRTDKEEEQRLRQYLAKGTDIPWIQIHTVAPHVHFTHSGHVRMGQMACVDCHEDMTQMVRPPMRATVLSMDACIGCHEERHVSTDCLVCHK